MLHGTIKSPLLHRLTWQLLQNLKPTPGNHYKSSDLHLATTTIKAQVYTWKYFIKNPSTILGKNFYWSPSIILAKIHFKKAQKLFGKNIISYSKPKANNLWQNWFSQQIHKSMTITNHGKYLYHIIKPYILYNTIHFSNTHGKYTSNPWRNMNISH